MAAMESAAAAKINAEKQLRLIIARRDFFLTVRSLGKLYEKKSQFRFRSKHPPHRF